MKVPKTTEQLVGMRKLVLAFAALVTLALGLVLILAFKQLTDVKWDAWVLAVAGVATAYITGNLVAKKLDKR
jgi:multisubunit Na+/H+ antiporter MnhB subunit